MPLPDSHRNPKFLQETTLSDLKKEEEKKKKKKADEKQQNGQAGFLQETNNMNHETEKKSHIFGLFSRKS